MPSYCNLTDLKLYLNVAASNTTDDTLLYALLDAATARIDSFTGRTFQAPADSTRYYDIYRDTDGYELYFDTDLSHVTSITNGDAVDVTSSLYFNPRNTTPFYKCGFKESSAYSWTYTTDPQDAITVVGRFAYLDRVKFTAIARASSIVQATVTKPVNIPVGNNVYVVDVADSTFNGTYATTSISGTVVTWAATAADDTDTTGYLLFTPADIVTACRRLAAWMYRQKDTQNGDIDRPLLAGDGSVIMPTTLPQDVAMLLKPYIRNVL